jgi:hypothetical protein
MANPVALELKHWSPKGPDKKSNHYRLGNPSNIEMSYPEEKFIHEAAFATQVPARVLNRGSSYVMINIDVATPKKRRDAFLRLIEKKVNES